MIIGTMLLALVGNFLIHFWVLTKYCACKKNRYLFLFLGTGIINVGLMAAMSYLAIIHPDLVHAVNFKLCLWIISGLIMMTALTVQVVVGCRIYKRIRNPLYYHYNYFGRKVLNKDAVKKTEFALMICMIPFFTLIGAYFVARLINIIRHGQL